ncbi:dihydroorotate dehydrogenase [Acidiplasma aeolicum]|jgi:dihydroorotate dehydrogenase electron transfer subunit|uniref:Dihydroorotate dehydrogenase n=1 Tax=Acidiplasma aeolicum TaxID=507754 RepID=A0A0P9ETL3_9ARCH|nr:MULTISPECIES: dihydroorotate dehydrogenase electron transfer subunit [Acidiplasma]KPV47419.1 dihydroorotate dehydrogenase [Acidiplasma aeolicum]
MNYSIVYSNVRINESTHSLRFFMESPVHPGQFIMIWAPGIGEIPISFSSVNNPVEITVKIYGEPSKYIANLMPGEKIFYRGPYGRPFTGVTGKKLIIGAGTGIAPLMPLVDNMTSAILSAKTKNDLIFTDRIKNLYVVTDDGTLGIKGFAVDALKQMDINEFDMIYVCGPEIMMKSVYDYLLNKTDRVEFSLERPMKCGIGICDSCSINGIQVCRDGPVFSIKDLKNMDEFGRTRLSFSGKRIYL